MSGRARAVALLVASLAVVTSACDRGGDGDAASAPSTTTSTASVADGSGGPESPHGVPASPHGGPLGATAPTAPPAPEFAVPSTVDAPYVERVLAELDRVQGDVVRSIVASRAYEPDAEVSVRAVFNDPEFAVQSEVFRRLVADVDRARNPPGDNRSTVIAILAATPSCISVETEVDVSGTALEPPPPYRVFVVLRPTQPGADPQDRNRTPWSIADELPKASAACR